MQNLQSVIIPAQTQGVNDLYDYNEIYLDSLDRDQGTADRPQWNLSTPIQNAIGIKIISAEIPFSYYTLTNHNNGSFYENSWILTDNLGAAANALSVTQGYAAGNSVTINSGAAHIDGCSYTTSEAETQLAAALTGASVGGWATYTVVWQAKYGKFDISSNKAEAWYITCQASPNAGWAAESATPMKFFGFNEGLSTATSAGYLRCPNYANLTGPNTVNICGNIGSLISKSTNFNGSTTLLQPSSFAQVSVNCNPGEMILYKDVAQGYYFDCGGGVIQNISLYLAFGSLQQPFNVELNGLGFTLVIGVLTKRGTSISDYKRDGVESSGTLKRVRLQ